MKNQSSMCGHVKIKICGLSRPCDIDFVNAQGPDFIGFVINFPKSRRNVTPRQAADLRGRLRDGIVPVGVFVDEEAETVARLLNEGVIDMAQLHGREDEAYIQRLRGMTDKKLVKAFRVTSPRDVEEAKASSADYILLDNGTGTGRQFDWSLIEGVERPWFLAGGLDPQNLAEAARRLRPWSVDLSSGVETDGQKDAAKIEAAVRAAREVAYPL